MTSKRQASFAIATPQPLAAGRHPRLARRFQGKRAGQVERMVMLVWMESTESTARVLTVPRQRFEQR